MDPSTDAEVQPNHDDPRGPNLISDRFSRAIRDLNSSVFIEELSGKNKTGFFATYFNLFKILIGIGVLALPMAIELVGLVLGIVGMIIISLMSYYSLFVNAESKQHLGKQCQSYSDLARIAVGPKMEVFISGCV